MTNEIKEHPSATPEKEKLARLLNIADRLISEKHKGIKDRCFSEKMVAVAKLASAMNSYVERRISEIGEVVAYTEAEKVAKDALDTAYEIIDEKEPVIMQGYFTEGMIAVAELAASLISEK